MQRDRGGTGIAVLLAVAGVIVALGLSIGIYAAVYGTADIRGRVAVHNEVLSGQSRLQLTRHFHDLFASLTAQREQARVAWQTYLTDKDATGPDPFGQHAQQVSTDLANYTGVVQLCVQNSNDYNQQSQDTTRGLFVEASLPQTVDPKECEQK